MVIKHNFYLFFAVYFAALLAVGLVLTSALFHLIGMSPKYVMHLGTWSALWLERLYESGFAKLFVYMDLVHYDRLPFEALKPQRHKEYGLTGICPFMLAATVASVPGPLLKGKLALGAPASTHFFGAALCERVALWGKTLRIRHSNYSVLFSPAGIELEEGGYDSFGALFTEDNGPMLLELTDKKVDPLPVRHVDSVCIPEIRLRDGNVLDLSN